MDHVQILAPVPSFVLLNLTQIADKTLLMVSMFFWQQFPSQPSCPFEQPVIDATPPLGNFQDLPSLGSRSTTMTEELPRSILQNKLNLDQTGRNSLSILSTFYPGQILWAVQLKISPLGQNFSGHKKLSALVKHWQ